MPTKIEWATDTWNPIRTIDLGYHCTKISEGCANCYAERLNKRFGNGQPFDSSNGVFHPYIDCFEKPLHWKKPRRIFVQSMGDLFHEDVPDKFLDYIFAVMAKASQHTFMVLTKRPERMQKYILKAMYDENCSYQGWYEVIDALGIPDVTPMENVWCGVTAENQARADERIPILLEIPVAKRFVSIEPMLGPVDLREWLADCGCVRCQRRYFTDLDELEYSDNDNTKCPECGCDIVSYSGYKEILKLDWLICGGETGPGARPMHPGWVRSLRDQCQAAGVPFFFKSWGDWWPGEKGRLYRKQTIDWSDGQPMVKSGKKNAGRLLDGVEHSEFPEVRS